MKPCCDYVYLFIFNKSKKRTPVSSELTVLDKTQKLYKHQRWYYMTKKRKKGTGKDETNLLTLKILKIFLE